MAADNTQLICTTEPLCLCSDDDACDCEAYADGKRCVGCGALLKAIDCDTGEDAP